MNVHDMQQIYDYDRWANNHLLEVLATLPAQQFTQFVAGSHGSLRNTIIHQLSAEWGWLARCGGPERGSALNPEDFPTLGSVVDLWKKIDGFVQEFFSTLTDQALTRRVDFSIGSLQRRSMSVESLLLHAAVHAAHHRGQIALLLRMLAREPGNFDLVFFYADGKSTSGP